MHLIYKFTLLNIKINKTIFCIFLKCRSISHKFHKLIIESKNACKDMNKLFLLNFGI